jgi:hypothetical protein
MHNGSWRCGRFASDCHTREHKHVQWTKKVNADDALFALCENHKLATPTAAAGSTPPNDSLWRELLWMNHARYTGCQHLPYGDDGEMQCCGIDFKRWSAEQIGEYLTKRAALQGEPGGEK